MAQTDEMAMEAGSLSKRAGRALHVKAFGSMRAFVDGQEQPIRAAKTRALLAYLAVEARPISRRQLAELLWGNERLGNVRQAIYGLRQIAGSERWLHTGELVEVRASTDTREFERLLTAGEYKRATDLARGVFLEALRIPGDLPFHEWRAAQRSALEPLVADALSLRAQQLARRGMNGAARSLEARSRPAHSGGDRGEEGSAELLSSDAAGRVSDARPSPAGLSDPRDFAIVRDAELQRARSALAQGRSVLLVGPTGMGKSRVASALARARPTHLFFESELGDHDVPLSAVRRFLASVVEHLGGRDALASRVPPWVVGELELVAPEVFGAAAAALAPTPARTMRALDEVFAALSEVTSLLVIDGLGALDADSQRLLLRGAHASAGSRMPLLVTYRSDRQAAPPAMLSRLLAGASIDRVELSGWTLRQMRRALEASGTTVASERLRQLHEASGGNPWLVFEQLRHGAWLDEEDSGHTGGDSERDLPTHVRQHFEAALKTLERPTCRLVEMLAVAAAPTPAELLADALSLSLLDTSDAIDAAASRGLLSDGWFQGSLVRHAVMGSLSAERVRALHRSLAEALDRADAPASARAERWLSAGEPERAATHFLQAGREARQGAAHSSAMLAFERALDASQDPKTRVQAYLAAAQVAPRAEREPYLRQAEQLARARQRDPDLFQVAIQYAEHAIEARNIEVARLYADEAHEIAERLGEPSRQARAYVARGTVRLRSGLIADAREDFETAERHPDEATRIGALWGLGACAGYSGDLETARVHHAEALTMARRSGALRECLRLLNGLGATCERMAEYAASKRHFARALTLADQLGDVNRQVALQLNLSEVHRKHGALGPAHRALQDAAPLLSALESPRLSTIAAMRRGLLSAALGAFEQAEREFLEVEALAREVGDRRQELAAACNRGLVVVESTGDSVPETLASAEALHASGSADIARWAFAELALAAPDASSAAAALEQLAAREDSADPHMRYVVELARRRWRSSPMAPAAAPDVIEAAFVDGHAVDLSGLTEPQISAWKRRLRRRRQEWLAPR